MSTIDHVPANPTDTFLRLAYLRKRDEIRAFVVSDADRINGDVVRVCTSVAGILPKLVTLRPDLVEAIRHFDVARFDSLADYAHALYYSHGRHVATTQGAPLDPALVIRGARVRDQLHRATGPLVDDGVIPATAVATLKTDTSHRGLMTDLLVSHQAFTDYSEAIAGRTTVTQAHLDEAMEILQKLEAGVGKRDVSPAEISEAKQERRQAFFLLLDVYDEIRDGVRLVRRRQRDAHLFAPSLLSHPLNSGRRHTSADEEEGAEAPAVNTGETGVHPAVTTPSAPANDVTATTFAPGTFKRTGQ